MQCHLAGPDTQHQRSLCSSSGKEHHWTVYFKFEKSLKTDWRQKLKLFSAIYSYFSKLLDQVSYPKGCVAGREQCYLKSLVAKQFPLWWSKEFFSVSKYSFPSKNSVCLYLVANYFHLGEKECTDFFPIFYQINFRVIYPSWHKQGFFLDAAHSLTIKRALIFSQPKSLL